MEMLQKNNELPSTGWKDELYKKTFDEEFLGIERRCLKDQNFDIKSLEKLLDGLYLQEGSDWLGRGAVGETILSAQIAAYECFIATHKKCLQLA